MSALASVVIDVVAGGRRWMIFMNRSYDDADAKTCNSNDIW